MGDPGKTLKPTTIGRVVSVTKANGDEYVGALAAFRRTEDGKGFLVYLQGVGQPVEVPADGSVSVHQRAV
ncbi:hypothetical protein [Arthrobacter sp. NPDC089319]|uniref:hypothetical protein n=1 Tax=Arthrobacter sp. NPDC089319 TaxID=3155915 RepID=UPI00343FBFFB